MWVSCSCMFFSFLFFLKICCLKLNIEKIYRYLDLSLTPPTTPTSCNSRTGSVQVDCSKSYRFPRHHSLSQLSTEKEVSNSDGFIGKVWFISIRANLILNLKKHSFIYKNEFLGEKFRIFFQITSQVQRFCKF